MGQRHKSRSSGVDTEEFFALLLGYLDEIYEDWFGRGPHIAYDWRIIKASNPRQHDDASDYLLALCELPEIKAR